MAAGELAHIRTTENILRDMSDGVLIIDSKGSITYINSSAAQMLDVNAAELTGRLYASLLDSNEDNSDFHQFVLDAVYDKEKIHKGIVAYRIGDEKKKLSITTSYIFDEEKSEKIGISVVLTDVTELHNLMEVRKESSIIFAVIISVISLFLYIYRGLWESNPDISPALMTWLVEGLALLGMIVLFCFTSIRFTANFRLKEPWKQMQPFVYICIVCVLVLAAIKFVIQALGIPFFPEGVAFWDWGQFERNLFNTLIYPFTVVLQEILARCMMQESLYHIFSEKYKSVFSIFLSSLIFGIVHIAHGFFYMIAAFILLCMLGVLYERTRNLWGVSLVHFVLGLSAVFMRFTS